MIDNVNKSLIKQVPHIRRIVMQMSKNADVADDITQECLVRIIEKQHLWNCEKGQLSKWMNTVSRNLTRRALSNRSKEHSKKTYIVDEELACCQRSLKTGQ